MSSNSRRAVWLAHTRLTAYVPLVPASLLPLGPEAAASPVLAVEVAHAALRDTLRDLADVQRRGALGEALDTPEVDRWADEGGPLGRLYAGGRQVSGGERRAWEAHAFACDRVNTAVGTYARALRRDGVGLAAALVAVRATVQHGTTAFSARTFAAVRRDAAQCCLEALYAH